MAHDAHHRGQILLALKTNGHPLPDEESIVAAVAQLSLNEDAGLLETGLLEAAARFLGAQQHHPALDSWAHCQRADSRPEHYREVGRCPCNSRTSTTPGSSTFQEAIPELAKDLPELFQRDSGRLDG